MKRVLAVLVIILLVTPILGFADCGGSNSLTDSDIATIRGFATRMDGAESDIAARPTLIKVNDLIEAAVSGVSTPDLSGYATDVELTAAFTNLVANLTPEQITALKTALGISTSTTPETPTTGEVTVELVGTSPVKVWVATAAGANFTGQAQFTVKITNGTDTNQYVSYSLSLYCEVPLSGAGVVVQNATTVLTDYDGSVGFTKTFLPTLPTVAPTPQFLCYFTTNTWGGVLVPAGKSLEIIHLVTLITNLQSWWSCDVAGFRTK